MKKVSLLLEYQSMSLLLKIRYAKNVSLLLACTKHVSTIKNENRKTLSKHVSTIKFGFSVQVLPSSQAVDPIEVAGSPEAIKMHGNVIKNRKARREEKYPPAIVWPPQ